MIVTSVPFNTCLTHAQLVIMPYPSRSKTILFFRLTGESFGRRSRSHWRADRKTGKTEARNLGQPNPGTKQIIFDSKFCKIFEDILKYNKQRVSIFYDGDKSQNDREIIFVYPVFRFDCPSILGRVFSTLLNSNKVLLKIHHVSLQRIFLVSQRILVCNMRRILGTCKELLCII